MSALLQTLLDLVGDPDRPNLVNVRAPLQARIAEMVPEQRKQLYDECFAAWKNIPRENSQPYYRHFIVFQHLSKATHTPRPLTREQQEVWEYIRKQREQNNGRWYESQATSTPEEVLARHPLEAMLESPSGE